MTSQSFTIGYYLCFNRLLEQQARQMANSFFFLREMQVVANKKDPGKENSLQINFEVTSQMLGQQDIETNLAD